MDKNTDHAKIYKYSYQRCSWRKAKINLGLIPENVARVLSSYRARVQCTSCTSFS